jgi:catechol 2,3-dioxygenase
MGILRLGYLEIRVKEINKAAQYYTQVLGLKETARAAGKIYLKAWDEWEHHQLVLVEDPSPGLNHMAFRLESLDDLPFFENKLERNGCRVERVGGADKYELGEAIRFTAPSEHRVELYYDMTIVGNGLPTTNPPPYPDGLLGIHPPRMDHTLLTTPDTPASLHFWQEVMGFRLTEQVVTPEGAPLAIWLERTRTPHDLAFIPGRPGGLHHFAFWLDSWEAIGRSADVLARAGVQIDTGPTRHGITRGHTIYFFDSSGNRNEVFTGGYWADPRMSPITWTADEMWMGIFYWDRCEKGAFISNYT